MLLEHKTLALRYVHLSSGHLRQAVEVLASRGTLELGAGLLKNLGARE